MKIFQLTSFSNMFNPKKQLTANCSFGTTARCYPNNKETAVQDNVVLTNTWLFRDDVDWDNFVKYMEKTFRNKGKVHVYSLASSDGSEAFTLAMTLNNIYDKTVTKKFLPIIASDRDKEMVKAAKSGFINLRYKDLIRIRERDIDPKKYFALSRKRLEIENDSRVPGIHSYKISKFLKDAVNFEQADLMEKLKNIKDNSNTVVMCKNVTPYLSSQEVLDVALNASKNLQKGSLFVIGKYDANTDIANYLKNLGFQSVMKNVFQKVV